MNRLTAIVSMPLDAKPTTTRDNSLNPPKLRPGGSTFIDIEPCHVSGL